MPGCGGAAEQPIKVPWYFLRFTERLDAGLAAQTMTDIKRKRGVAENKFQRDWEEAPILTAPSGDHKNW